MSTASSFKSLASATLLFAGLGLCGCYDLGDPTGPTAADFEAQKNAASTAENDDTSAPADCPDGTCSATPTPVASLESEGLRQKLVEKNTALLEPTAQK